VTARRFVALLVLFAFAAPLAADVGPPPGKKRVPVTTIVEVTEELPDFVFFTVSISTYYGAPPGPPGKDDKSDKRDKGGWQTDTSVSLVTIAPGRPAKDTGAHRSGSSLYAVPKAVADKNGDYAKLAQEIRANKVPGAAYIGFGTTQELPVSDSRTAITVRYRAERTPSGGITFTPLDDSPGGTTESPPARTVRPPSHWWIAGLAASAAAVLTGLWLLARAVSLKRRSS
jgi:hypothetical protein